MRFKGGGGHISLQGTVPIGTEAFFQLRAEAINDMQDNIISTTTKDWKTNLFILWALKYKINNEFKYSLN